MILIALALAWAFIGFCPETAAGRALRRVLVEGPAGRLSSVKPATALFVFAMAIVTAAALLFLEGEALFVVVQAAPEAAVWFAAFDVATYIDVMAIAWVLGRGARLKVLAGLVAARARAGAARAGAWMRRVSRRAGRDPSAPVGRRLPPANDDDEPAAGFALAA